jgi:hypothetical protein
MGIHRHQNSAQTEDESLELFRRLLRQECALVAREGITVLPFESEDIPHFRRLTSERQQEVIHQVSETVSVYDELLAESLSLRDNSQLLWRCLRRLKLIPSSDLFDKLTDEDIIVIFAPDQRQIFRNLEFLRHSILTLEELYTTEWYRYTRRDASITQKIRELATDLSTGKKTGTFDPGIEEHVIEQVGSNGPAKLRIKINYVSPVTAAGKIEGIVVLERGWSVED